MSFLHNTFLGAAYARSKTVFMLCCLFIIGCFVPVVVRFEITPFYDWSMYALTQMPRQTYEVLRLRYNGETVYNPAHTCQDHRQMMVSYPLGDYDYYLTSGDTLPYNTFSSRMMQSLFSYHPKGRLHNAGAELSRYPEWLRRYLEQQTGESIRTLTAEKIVVRYDEKNRVVPIQTAVLFTTP